MSIEIGNSLFASIDASASGMAAERLRMEVIANNVANANTTKGEDGLPFRRKQVVFEEQRPFFQEGVELFGRGDLFYTRRVGGVPVGVNAAFDGLDSTESV